MYVYTWLTKKVIQALLYRPHHSIPVHAYSESLAVVLKVGKANSNTCMCTLA